jgi:hypothetical protein
MSLTYDQISELSIAFQEAHVPADRRRSNRIKHKIAAELTEWNDGKFGRTFGVTIDDFSTTGVGLEHSGSLKNGGRYMLEIPRPGQPPIRVLLTVVRCSRIDGGLFSTTMQASEILAGRIPDQRPHNRAKTGILVSLFLFLAAASAAYWFLL